MLDSVDALNQKLSSYKQWIRELELALAQESQLHPLLNTELLRMTDDMPEEHEEDAPEAFGSLELGEDGKSRWMGPQAISSWILQVSWLLPEISGHFPQAHIHLIVVNCSPKSLDRFPITILLILPTNIQASPSLTH